MAHWCPRVEGFGAYTNWRWRLIEAWRGNYAISPHEAASQAYRFRPGSAVDSIFRPPPYPPGGWSLNYQRHPETAPWPEALSDNRRVLAGTGGVRGWTANRLINALAAIFPDELPRVDLELSEFKRRWLKLGEGLPCALVNAVRWEQTGRVHVSPANLVEPTIAHYTSLLSNWRAQQAEADALEPFAEAWDLANR